MGRTCRDCARIDRKSLENGFCPVTAAIIGPGRCAERCRYFKEGTYEEMAKRRKKDVR